MIDCRPSKTNRILIIGFIALIVISMMSCKVTIEIEPLGNKQDDEDAIKAERAQAFSNAAILVACMNAHNAYTDTDYTINKITGTDTDSGMTLFEVTDVDAGTLKQIESQEEFNIVCVNGISGMTDAEDFMKALEYIIIIKDTNKFGIDENHDHTKH